MAASGVVARRPPIKSYEHRFSVLTGPIIVACQWNTEKEKDLLQFGEDQAVNDFLPDKATQKSILEMKPPNGLHEGSSQGSCTAQAKSTSLTSEVRDSTMGSSPRVDVTHTVPSEQGSAQSTLVIARSVLMEKFSVNQVRKPRQGLLGPHGEFTRSAMVQAASPKVPITCGRTPRNLKCEDTGVAETQR